MARIAIIGAGPAGLIAAERLSAKGHAVTIYERKKSPARKFLLAGRGGLNITHSEALPSFLERFGGAREFLEPAIEDFTPDAMRDWCKGLGEETFIGSSGRVFPKSLKASPLLRAWLRRLQANGVEFKFQSLWRGWDHENRPAIAGPEGESAITCDAFLLALGGASWPELGSDGTWAGLLSTRGVSVKRFKPANCGFHLAWSEFLKTKFSGAPLKSISVTAQGRIVAGEVMIDANGIEGGAIYALSSTIRDMIEREGSAEIFVDLKPALPLQAITDKLSTPRKRLSFSTYLKKALNLSPLAIALLHETDKNVAARDAHEIAALLKSLPLRLTAPFAVERAISTAGGIALDELDGNFMFRKLPGVFAAGEMLDWEAPTGGYLLQASFATGAAAAVGIERWLSSPA